MKFKFIDKILGFFPDLRVLERNSQPYNLLLYQHEGSLTATSSRIGNPAGDAKAYNQLISFFKLLRELNVDLGISPEYSCPWGVIEFIIGAQQNWPSERKLWAIGAESISKKELISFKEKYHSKDVNIFFDNSLLTSNETFFDPFVYFIKTFHNKQIQLQVIIQFKTYHMGVWQGGEIERNNIILGNEIYILRNSKTSIHLMSLICSEAMNFEANMTRVNKEFINWLDGPYLIINPQLNGNPLHPNFTAFHRFVMARPHKEIITLNWCMNSKLKGKNLIPIGTSRSGIIIGSSEVDQADYQRIRQNHANGLYYFNFGILNKHAFLCNSYVSAFHIQTSAVDISDVMTQQAKRDGPRVISIYCIYDNHNLVKTENPPSDYSIRFINSLGCNNQFLCDEANCVIEKERLACITACEIPDKSTSEWYHISNLSSMKIDETTELNRRLTFAEDTIAESASYRRIYIRAFNHLEHILVNRKDLFPESIIELKALNPVVGFHQKKDEQNRKIVAKEKYKYNVYASTGEPIKATICFMEDVTDSEVDEKFDSIQSLFDDNANRGRVVIFYQRGNNILVKSDLRAGKITSIYEKNGPSILKE